LIKSWLIWVASVVVIVVLNEDFFWTRDFICKLWFFELDEGVKTPSGYTIFDTGAIKNNKQTKK